MTRQNQILTPTVGFLDILTPPNELSRETNLSAQPSTLPSSTPVVQISDQHLTLDIILSNLRADNISDWFNEIFTKLSSRYKRLPRGSWSKITDFYNNRFNDGKSLLEVRNLYNRAKLQSQQRTILANQEFVQPVYGEATKTIRNSDLFRRVCCSLQKNINVYRTNVEKPRTRKIYSCQQNNEVLEMLNIAMLHNSIPDKIESIKELNDVLYSCQKTYEEVTEKPPKPSVWKASIENKVSELKKALVTLNNNPTNATSSPVMKKLCKKFKIHSNARNEVDKLKDRLLETCAMYEKKLEVAKNRACFHKTNKAFELNRKNFYRELDGKSKQVNPDINREEVVSFWHNLWKKDSIANDFNRLVSCFKPITLVPDLSAESIGEMVQNAIKYLSNWKAAGHDRVFNFFIKKMTALHPKLHEIVFKCILSPDQIDESFYSGLTYLLAKSENASDPADLRPITCMPNLYKLVSKIVASLIGKICDMNNVISTNQMGTRKRCQGAKEQALVNKCLNDANDNKLLTAWIDISKAFDSVNHNYVISCLERLSLPPFIIEFTKRMLAKQKTELYLLQDPVCMARIENGIMQGDSLSPLLFVIAMEPLSRILNSQHEKVALPNSSLERNHLIFIDDIKLLARDEDALKDLCHCTRVCLDIMGFRLNEEKSANNVGIEEAFGKQLDDQKGYKYLGILEDSKNAIKEENKSIIREKILDRTEALCMKSLNARNMFHAINEFAISTINYYVGVVEFEPKELDQLDAKIRQILAKYGITRKSSNMERLYIDRRQLGRGLQNIKEKAELLLLNLHDHLDKEEQTRAILICEQRLSTQLGMIKQFTGHKYGVTAAINSKALRLKHQEKRMERIRDKRMHSIVFDNSEGHVDTKASSLWLRKGNISAKEEGMLCKLQDRNIFFHNKSCPHCHQGKMSVEHLATNCGRMLNFDYKKRHDDVVRCLHFMFAKKFGLNERKRLKAYKVEKVISNERVRIKSDMPIITDNRIEHNKPDLMVHDLKTNEILLIEVGITNKRILPTTEVTKARKYEFLANELKLMHRGAKVTIVPVVLTWDGLVTRHFKRYMSQLGVSERIQAYIQGQTLKRTCESILVDARSMPSDYNP
ncbi:MAG: reverse transcriptase family protein [Turicibacter sp.]|nr:reverse transcriptase family protein [Turicibacter sp.]